MQYSFRSHTSKKRFNPLIVVGAVLMVAAVAAGLELTNTTHLFHKEKPKPIATTGGASTKGITPESQSGTSDNKSGSDKVSSNTESTNSTQTLLAPWGTFANVYKAGPDDQMGSTCNTTSGATCEIIFTNGDQTKSLAVQATDKGGAAYWSWKPKDIGLTPGTWHITAKAVLGNQTKTTSNDPLTLEITS